MKWSATDDQQIPLSQIAMEKAEENRRVMRLSQREATGVVRASEQMPEEAGPTAREMDRCNDAEVAIRMGEILVEKNLRPVTERGKDASVALQSFADDLDAAADKFSEALEKFVEGTDGLSAKVRDRRMALSSEVRAILKDLRDFEDFAGTLDGALETMNRLVELGRSLRDAYGEDGLSRIAEAILVASGK